MMLHDLYKRKSNESLSSAYEEGSFVHPQLKYMVITPKEITFHLQDDRSITLSSNTEGELVYIEQPPVNQQYRSLFNVNVVGPDVFITLNKNVHVQCQKDGEPDNDAEWQLTTSDDPRLRRAIMNRFLKDGKYWPDPIDIETFSIWRDHDYDTTISIEETSE